MSDFSPVLHAGRSHDQRLLDAGVQLHERQDAVLHANSAAIDGVVSTVGSSNMDWRSRCSCDEVNAVVLGEDFGDAMQPMFRQDRADSHAITAQAWAAALGTPTVLQATTAPSDAAGAARFLD